ncbi:MAG: hypothetical protein EOO14_08685 [Chitinophagaceae bacterium]|nr:MAG: hypothetical protein EOO14_08685 [Chitinophagaceae bacterium]
MTKKDFTSSENIEREKDGAEPQEPVLTEAEDPGKTVVKNAHAAGDGSFGRNETSLPEEDGNVEKTEADPPY